MPKTLFLSLFLSLIPVPSSLHPSFLLISSYIPSASFFLQFSHVPHFSNYTLFYNPPWISIFIHIPYPYLFLFLCTCGNQPVWDQAAEGTSSPAGPGPRSRAWSSHADTPCLGQKGQEFSGRGRFDSWGIWRWGWSEKPQGATCHFRYSMAFKVGLASDGSRRNLLGYGREIFCVDFDFPLPAWAHSKFLPQSC